MYGFRQNQGTQDVLIQLQELVVKKATGNVAWGILTLELKVAFGNVSHASVLQNLNEMGCGRKTFGYIKDFLTRRTATIRIEEEKSEPVKLGEKGTPQGTVFLLKEIEGVHHALYADDITVWTNRAGSDAWAEEVLQRAATTAHGYAKTCGLSCASHKSELLMVEPGRPKKELLPNVTITIDGTAIKPTQQIRILGLLLQSDGRASTAVTKIKNSSEQILSMI
ncbi:uncharacterized protein LOC144166048 [Haemaphysalis longicornis]